MLYVSSDVTVNSGQFSYRLTDLNQQRCGSADECQEYDKHIM